ncbi:galectin-9-like [Acanthaster planci]|uniref:Galectin n=1 Tax=Acanthaster planci TaxID=133434 RepID=A0A8B8A0S0_ACAPL|nr:galectin-9-like [Acanthaster planci]
MSDVVTNPDVPYSEQIPGGYFPSKTIYIRGSVPSHSDRFHVNLQSEVGTGVADVAFHFNPRFEGSQNYVVCNTKTGGSWQSEERHQDNFPFDQGKTFELVILCEGDEFKVAVNGRHYLDYKHRVNLQEIKAVAVAGDVEISSIRFHPPSAALLLGQSGIHIHDPPTPYVGPIGASGLQYGTMITVKLTVHPDPNRFAINLNGAYFGPQQDDIALHFNPRFPDRVIVRNSLSGGNWGGEERDGAFPFAPDGTHEVTILCMRKCMRVQVDGHHVIDYNHRHDVQGVKSMKVAGDVTIHEIDID